MRAISAARLRKVMFSSTDLSRCAVVGLMTRAAGAPVKAFSIGFDEPRFNELEYGIYAVPRPNTTFIW